MKSRICAVIGIGVFFAFVAWWMKPVVHQTPSRMEASEMSSAVADAAPEVISSVNEKADPSNPATQPSAPARKPGAGKPHAASARDLTFPLLATDPPAGPAARRVSDVAPDAAQDFDKIALMFRDYRTIAGENPVGTNAEIMKAMMGDNPKGAKLGPPAGLQLNENGELIDRWGTSYFFHQLTKDLMEIRSAGPDRRMWNDDDLIED